LFSVSDSPEIAMEQLQQSILDILDKRLDNLSQIIECALDKAIEKRSADINFLSESTSKNKN